MYLLKNTAVMAMGTEKAQTNKFLLKYSDNSADKQLHQQKCHTVFSSC